MRRFFPSKLSPLCRSQQQSQHGASFLASSSSSSSFSSAVHTSNLLSILDESIPVTPKKPTTTTQKQQNTNNTTSTSKNHRQSKTNNTTTISTNPLNKVLDFDILHPNVTPTSLSYICPPKWTSLVSDIVMNHFGYSIGGGSNNSSDANNNNNKMNNTNNYLHQLKHGKDTSAEKKASRPELFIQAFVHTSFLRDYERKRIESKLINTDNHRTNKDDVDGSVVDVDEMDDCSMARLAEVGASILQYSCTVLAPLLSEDAVLSQKGASSLSNNRNNNNNNNNMKDNKDDFSVFPIQKDITFFPGKDDDVSRDEQELNNEERDKYFQFIRTSFASPTVSISNTHILRRATSDGSSSDHFLSLVCFNVWKTSELVLTDAGIYGLRDAIRSSSKEKLKVPPLPMPAAAMNVRALVGAVYLNFGLEEAVMFCQKHVMCHAVSMMSESDKK